MDYREHLYQIKVKPCISSITQELHIINFVRSCISSSRQNVHLRCDDIQHGKAVSMICTLPRDDIPSLSAWIKKIPSQRTWNFLAPQTGLEPVTDQKYSRLTSLGALVILLISSHFALPSSSTGRGRAQCR